MTNELKPSSKVSRFFLLGAVVLGLVAVVAVFSYFGSSNQASASGRNSSDIDRRAPVQQREVARMVDDYYAQEKERAKEFEAIRGNPIKEENFNKQRNLAGVKFDADIAAFMAKTGGRFEDWVGTLQFKIETYPATGSILIITFIPDGMTKRSVFADEPTTHVNSERINTKDLPPAERMRKQENYERTVDPFELSS